MEHTANPAVRWMTRAEAASHLRISPRQLDRLKLPRSYLTGSKSPRFRQSDLDSAMTAASVTPAANVNTLPGSTSTRTPRPVIGAIAASARREWLRQMKQALAA